MLVRLATALRTLLLAPRLHVLDLLPALAVVAVDARTRAWPGAGYIPVGPDTWLWVEAAIGAARGDWAAVAAQGRPPGWPVATASLLLAGLPPVEAVSRVGTVSFSVLLGALYLSGTRLGGRLAGAAAVALAWNAEPLLEAAALVNSQPVFNTTVAAWAGIGVVLVGRRPFALGVLCGLYPLVKEQGVLLAGLAGLASLGMAAWARELRTHVPRLFGGALLGILPLVAVNYLEFASSGRLPKVLLPVSDALTARGWWNPFAAIPGAGAPPVAGAHSISASSIIGDKAASVFLTSLRELPWLATVALGLALVFGPPQRRGHALWTALLLAPVGPALALGFFYPYHLSFLVVPLVLLIAQGGAAALDGALLRLPLGELRWQAWAARLLVGAALVGAAWPWRYVPDPTEPKDLRGRVDPRSIAWTKAADAVRPKLPPGALVASTEPLFARALGGRPLDLGTLGRGPSNGRLPCEHWLAYEPDVLVRNGSLLRLQADGLPLGYRLVHWEPPAEAGHAPVIVAYLPGPQPDHPLCAPGGPLAPALEPDDLPEVQVPRPERR